MKECINIVPIIMLVVVWVFLIIGLVKSKNDPDQFHLFRDMVIVGMIVAGICTLVFLSSLEDIIK